MNLNKKKLIMLIKKNDYYKIYKEFKNWNIDKLENLLKEINFCEKTIFDYYFKNDINEKKKKIELNIDYSEYVIQTNKRKLENFIYNFNFLLNFFCFEEKEIEIQDFIKDDFVIPNKIIKIFNVFENDKNKKIIKKLENKYRG